MATSAARSGRISAHGNAGEASIFLVLANKNGSPKVRVGAEIGLTCLQATKKSLVCDG